MEKEKQIHTEVVDIDDLIQDDHNFNKGTEEGARLIERSFKDYGAGRSVLIDRNNRLVGGNKAQKGFKGAGFRKVVIVDSDADTLVAVRRKDVDLDSKEGRDMALLDNLTTQKNLAWDEVELQQVGANVEGFDVGDFGVSIDQLPGNPFDAEGKKNDPTPKETKEDDFDPDDVGESRVTAGDVWQLGEHRLMCGDSTSPECVKKLLDGVIPDMVFTDPPYGINLNGDNSKRGGATSIMQGGLKLKSFIDDSTEYACKAFDIVQDLKVKKQVWFGANYYCHHLPETNNWLIWDKRVEEKMSNTNSDCELAWVLDGHQSCRIFRYLWNGLIKAGEKGEKRVHPTQKPIALIAHCVERYAPEAKTLLDLFGGSGSSLIACEQLGIKCFMMELDTHYAGVIIARWEKLTGQKAVKL